jgi:hypothetical protein
MYLNPSALALDTLSNQIQSLLRRNPNLLTELELDILYSATEYVHDILLGIRVIEGMPVIGLTPKSVQATCFAVRVLPKLLALSEPPVAGGPPPTIGALFRRAESILHIASENMAVTQITDTDRALLIDLFTELSISARIDLGWT